MCVVSMVGDHYHDKWKDWPLPQITPIKINPNENIFDQLGVTREEFNQLKKEVEEMKQLLKRAKEYDEKNNEPNCEIEEKIKTLKAIAAFVGIDLDEIFKTKNGAK